MLLVQVRGRKVFRPGKFTGKGKKKLWANLEGGRRGKEEFAVQAHVKEEYHNYRTLEKTISSP